MAKSAAERKKAQREREAEAVKQSEDAFTPFVSSPFPERWTSDEEHHEVSFIAETLGSVGLSYLDFSKDEDPELEEGLAGEAENRGALGRAERTAGAMLDSAVTLYEMIHRYKIAEVEKALVRIAQSDLSNPTVKKQALKDVVTLESLKRRLTKQVRRTFPDITTRKAGL